MTPTNPDTAETQEVDVKAETPPVWYREDLVRDALQSALLYAVEQNGDAAKAVAWDVNYKFWASFR